MFQSLIGTVQLQLVWTCSFRRLLVFQSLIGTVQQQYLLRFLFSLYPIFPVFQPFSSKKSVNLFIVNSRKALILLAFLFLSKLTRRFTDFSAVFLLFSALFHAVFVLEALILLAWRFTDFFYRILNNPSFNSTYTVYMACPSTHISEIAILPAPSIVYKSVTCFYRPPCCPVLSQTLL